MNTFKIFLLHVVIQLLSKIQTDALVSSLLDSTSAIRCVSPFLPFNKMGYIQCQRICISYSRCNVLRYNRLHLECSLFVTEHCWDYSGDPDSNIYMRRDGIHESIGGSCHTPGCPAEHFCVMVKGVAKCIPDKVPTPYADHRATSINVDGVIFWMYPDVLTYAAAEQICGSTHGRLAILDTQRKRQLVQAEGNKHSNKIIWIVGATLSDKGEWLWNNGETASDIYLNHDGSCCVMHNSLLHDHTCNLKRSFICEVV